MKKIISALLAAISLFILLASCSGGGSALSGTYQCDERRPDIDGRFYKITFEGDKCTVYESSFSYDNLDWALNGDKLSVTGDVKFIMGNVHFDYEYTFAKEGDSIFLDGVEFKKQ